jgi:hypothetical protein
MTEHTDGNGKERSRNGNGMPVLRFGREVPLTLLFSLAIQTGGFVWWASGLSRDMAHLQEDIRVLREQWYTQKDAVRDMALVNEKLHNLDARIGQIENALNTTKGRRQ